jgi:hypothetical protein
MAKSSKSFHTGTVKKVITIKKSKEKIWGKISNIIGLPTWVIDVKKTVFLSKTKRGIGAIRKITFADGNQIEEHVVGWRNGEYFSYIAVSGLPLRAYHATLSITSLGKQKSRLTWQSYFNSENMTKKEFNEFVSFLGEFYSQSLKNLKVSLEK